MPSSVSFIESGYTTKAEYEAALKSGAIIKPASENGSSIGITVGTHSGTFQADEALGVWLLRRLDKYRTAPLTRSRDTKVLDTLTIVIDVAGLYDHSKLRYDHHQRGFFETFDGENAAAKDGGMPDVKGPDTATGTFKTKLSASGLVYKHYGKEILCALHPSLAGSADDLEWVFTKLYNDFMEGLDANDNGIGARLLGRKPHALLFLSTRLTHPLCASLFVLQKSPRRSNTGSRRPCRTASRGSTRGGTRLRAARRRTSALSRRPLYAARSLRRRSITS